MRRALQRGPALLLALLASAAAAHEVSHEIVYGRAVAVRARFAGAEPLAYAEYQVFSPSDPKIPWQKGRTDRDGWLAFVPSEPGEWRVQVADDTGHGMTLSFAPLSLPARPDTTEGTISWLVRLGAAVAVVGLVFGALVAVQRSKKGRA